MKICEWVPNFSEGANAETISRLKESASSVSGAFLLHTDSNEGANRTVMTIAGTPEALQECAFRTCKTASELIDMSSQSGEHPRSGSIDVSPFIPLKDMSVGESLALCRRLGTMVWQSLGIPVYFYAKAARSPERIRLPNIRKGGYEGLGQKLKDPCFRPDIGDPVFNEKNGIMVCGVRNIMVAWNISIDSKDTALAENIAAEIRESGRKGKPGLFRGVQARGWYMEQYGCAQISCNLHKPWDSALADIYSVAAKKAHSAGTRICGSEIIGLVPEQLLVQAGREFTEIKKSRPVPAGTEQDYYIRQAVSELGLGFHAAFDPGEKILDRLVKKYIDPDFSLSFWQNQP